MNNSDMRISHIYSDFIERLAAAASDAIMPHFRTGHDVENKLAGGFDPVTVADKAGETAMRSLINAEFPDHGILGEEHGPENTDAEHVWVLDPIDGTRAFITGLPTWGTLIGLTEKGTPRLGMMMQPYVREAYVGDCDTAWYKGPIGTKALKTRSCQDLADAVMFTTTPALFQGEERTAYDAIEAKTKLARYGTDCYGYCMVAAGHADLVIETSLQAYDVVALIPIVEGAGGVMTNWTGGSAADGGQIVASGDPRLHELVLKELATAAI